jgi:hypothetical protein
MSIRHNARRKPTTEPNRQEGDGFHLLTPDEAWRVIGGGRLHIPGGFIEPDPADPDDPFAPPPDPVYTP